MTVITAGKREPELVDFFAQCIPIDPEDRGGFDLIATALMEDDGQQQFFHLG